VYRKTVVPVNKQRLNRVDTEEIKLCRDCGQPIDWANRRWKTCGKCRAAKIKATQEYNRANNVTFTCPPRVIEAGHMYLIRFDKDLCKIGKTISLSKRLSQYRQKFPGCDYLHTFPVDDTGKAEDYFRSLYRRERDLNIGIEWFWLDVTDIEWFQTITNQADLTEAVFEAREAKFYNGGFWNLQDAWLERIKSVGRTVGIAPYKIVDGKVVPR
jgi:hypothetical protein